MRDSERWAAELRVTHEACDQFQFEELRLKHLCVEVRQMGIRFDGQRPINFDATSMQGP